MRMLMLIRTRVWLWTGMRIGVGMGMLVLGLPLLLLLRMSSPADLIGMHQSAEPRGTSDADKRLIWTNTRGTQHSLHWRATNTVDEWVLLQFSRCGRRRSVQGDWAY